MLRISAPTSAEGRTVLRLEGEIAGAWVDLLAEECRRVEGGQILSLDLNHVRYVDPAGRVMLRRLVATGVVLVRCSPMIEALLREEA